MEKKKNTKPDDSTYLQHNLLNILIPLLRHNTQKKKILFKIHRLLDYAPGHTRTVMELYSENSCCFHIC